MTQVGVGHPGKCRLCGSTLKRNGKTSAGNVRWRCTRCGSSSAKRRPDVTRRKELESFVGWLLGNTTQRDLSGGSGRSFREQHAWCWNVEPSITITGEIYDEIQLDGTYLADGWCLLLAINGINGNVIGFQWCDEEKTAAWKALLDRIPPPRVVVIDGGRGLASALAECWPETKIQRCLVHVQRNIRTYVTTNPRTEAGKGLRKLSLTLTRVRDQEQAGTWLVALNAWHQEFKDYLEERTNANDAGAVRPAWAKANAQSWWTHDRARKAYNLLALLVKREHLFTYLQEDFIELSINSTTNRIEGARNAGIKDLLRRHRGMTSPHQRRAVEWYCYLHSPKPKPPSSLIKPEHWQPPNPAPIIETNTKPSDWGDAIPDSTQDWEPGFYIRKGWAGRTA